MSGLYEISEQSMIAAHKAGMAYWNRNRPSVTDKLLLLSFAQSCGWHDEDAAAWLAGYFGAKRRDLA